MKNRFSIKSFFESHVEKARNDFSYGENLFNGFVFVVVFILSCFLKVMWVGIIFIILFYVGIFLLGNEKKEYAFTVATLGFVIFTFSIQSKDLDDRIKNNNQEIQKELDSLEIQKLTFRNQFRPWVGLDLSESVSVMDDSQTLTFLVKARFVNIGSFPAKNVQVTYFHQIKDEEIQKRTEESEPTALILPDQSITFTKKYLPQGEELFNKIIDGTKQWQMIIHIKYEGINTQEYYTEYQLKYDKSNKKFVMLSGDFN